MNRKRMLKNYLKILLEHSTLGYKLSLILKSVNFNPPPPNAPWMNTVLKTKKEYKDALDQIKRIGLNPHPDTPKNWDALASLALILKETEKRDRILDIGGEVYSPLVDWLFLYRYRNLHVINLSFKKDFKRGPIHYKSGDCTNAPYSDKFFDLITCLSVIEHVANIEKFFCESNRILKPGGLIVISTDYWRDRINSQNKRAYGQPVRIFNKEDIEGLIKIASRYGFRQTNEIDFTCHQKAVHWKRMDLYFTFIVFALKKCYL